MVRIETDTIARRKRQRLTLSGISPLSLRVLQYFELLLEYMGE